MGRAILDFDRVSPVQNGRNVRKGYELRDSENVAQRNYLLIVSRARSHPGQTPSCAFVAGPISWVEGDAESPDPWGFPTNHP
jgi:hypothetical protein